jgi:hypothetical protein
VKGDVMDDAGLRELVWLWPCIRTQGGEAVEVDYAVVGEALDALLETGVQEGALEGVASVVAQGCEAAMRLHDLAEQMGAEQVAVFFQDVYEVLCGELV